MGHRGRGLTWGKGGAPWAAGCAARAGPGAWGPIHLLLLSVSSCRGIDVRGSPVDSATAVHPVAEVEEALKMDPETFKMKYGIDKPRMDDENLIFYCQSGRRSAEATKIAITLGYTKARNYAGGYKEGSEKEGN